MQFRHRVVEFSGSEAYDALKAELDRIGARYRISRTGTVHGVEHWSLEWIVFENDPLYPRTTQNWWRGSACGIRWACITAPRRSRRPSGYGR